MREKAYMKVFLRNHQEGAEEAEKAEKVEEPEAAEQEVKNSLYSP